MSSSPTRHVVVDDQDSAIQYIGPGWSSSSGTAEASFGNFGPVYDDTLHLVSNTPGSSLRFEFSGTSVSMMGSIDNTGNKTLPSWQCFLDGQAFGQTSFPGITENNQVLCNAGSLSDGTHSVEVNVKTSGPTFYFDYIVYDPSPSVSLSDSVILIDNTDPSISLSGSGWVNRYGNLWPLTSTAGDQMTLKFVGKSVTVLGIAPGELSGNPTTGTYTVDGLQPTSFVIPGHGGLAEFKQVYFTTPDFDPGPHTLVITHQGNSNTAPFVLDLFYVANGAETLQVSPSATNQNQATSGTLPSTSASAFASASIGSHTTTNSSTSPSTSGGHPAAVSSRVAPSASGSVGGSPAASNSAAAEDAHSGHSTPIGAIIGGIVGGLALIVVVFLVFLFCRRRNTQRRPTGMTPITDMEVRPFARNTDSLITPFLPAHSTSYFAQPDALHGAPDLQPLRGSAKASPKTRRVSMPSIPATPLNHPTSAPERPSTGISASSSLPGTEMTSDSVSARRMSGWRVVHHEDSGVRMRGAAEGEVIDLPPTYTAD